MRPLLLLFLTVFSSTCGENLLDRVLEDGQFVVDSIDENINEYASVAEIANTIVVDLQKDYDITIDTGVEYALQNELVKFLLSSIDEQTEVLTGFPSSYKAIPLLLKALKPIGRRELALLDEDDQEVMKAADLFTNYVLRIKPMSKLIRENAASYRRRGLTEEEIREEVAWKKEELLRLWGNQVDEPDPMDYFDDLYDLSYRKEF